MKKIFFILISLLILVGCGEKSGIITSQSAEPAFIQTVYEGKCVMDEAPLWSIPGAAAEGAEITATITGTCQGAPILMLQYAICQETGRYFYEVKQNEKQGWVTSSFVVKELKGVSS
ncbi:hypothetical protein JW851_01395 [Candidatus Woesearchaeota archaeon]|nr:hypothetical protein [Candidatus Woesearchaeota archaeon]